jgi:hypothetical protein
MRKQMEGKSENLINKRREILAQNAAMKSKLETLKKIEKEVLQKFINLEEISNQKIYYLENEFTLKSRERLELEANNRLQDMDLKNEAIKNQQLEFTLTSLVKLEEQTQQENLIQFRISENIINNKIKTYETVNTNIKELENKSSSDLTIKMN